MSLTRVVVDGKAIGEIRGGQNSGMTRDLKSSEGMWKHNDNLLRLSIRPSSYGTDFVLR